MKLKKFYKIISNLSFFHILKVIYNFSWNITIEESIYELLQRNKK